jgi:hypothetical protein
LKSRLEELERIPKMINHLNSTRWRNITYMTIYSSWPTSKRSLNWNTLALRALSLRNIVSIITLGSLYTELEMVLKNHPQVLIIQTKMRMITVAQIVKALMK